MPVHSLVLKNARAVVEWGIKPAFSKADLIGQISKRAEEIRAEGESISKAFTRAITEDEIGVTLFKASKVADGPEIETDAVQDFVAAPPPAGPAHQAMQELADAHQKKNPNKTPAQSYASVYTDPKNSALRQRVVAEHLSPRLARDAADYQQRESDRNAERDAREVKGNRDVRGPHSRFTVDARNYLIKYVVLPIGVRCSVNSRYVLQPYRPRDSRDSGISATLAGNGLLALQRTLQG